MMCIAAFQIINTQMVNYGVIRMVENHKLLERRLACMNEEYVRFSLFKEDKAVIYDLKDELKALLNIVESDTNIEKWEKYNAYR